MMDEEINFKKNQYILTPGRREWLDKDSFSSSVDPFR